MSIHGAEKVGSMEPRPPALLGVVPAPAPKGVLIHKVLPDSAAQKAGLKVGDVILSINAVAMQSPQQLVAEIKKYFAESVVAVEYERAGNRQTVKIPLGIRLNSASLTGSQSPEINLPVYGSTVQFTRPPGKVLIIDFWATWCEACEPVRNALEAFKKAGKNADIDVIGITNEDAATIKAFYAGGNPPYKILIDASNEVTLKFRVEGYPTLAVIDKKGVIRFAGFASGGGFETAIELAKRLAKE